MRTSENRNSEICRSKFHLIHKIQKLAFSILWRQNIITFDLPKEKQFFEGEAKVPSSHPLTKPLLDNHNLMFEKNSNFQVSRSNQAAPRP